MLIKFITIDNNKAYCWCTTNTLELFRDFMQYVLDSCNKPEIFLIWDVENDKKYNMYQVATEVYGMRKRSFEEKLKDRKSVV